MTAALRSGVHDPMLGITLKIANNQLRATLSNGASPLAATTCPVDTSWLRHQAIALRRILYRAWQLDGGGPDDDADFRKIAESLGGAVFPVALAAALPTESGADLILSIPREWAFVPWEAAYLGDRPLGQRLGVARQLQGVDGPPRSPQAPGTRQFQIWANPQFDLLAAEQEAIRLSGQLSASLDPAVASVRLCRDNLDKRQLLESLRTADWFHFAGHAESCGESRRWRTADGELAPIDLRNAPGQYPRFIFAHACASADISPDSSEPSLVEAFLKAGVGNYLGLWTPLLDKYATQFTTQLYTRLLAGDSIAQAMLTTKTALAGKPGWSQIALANYVLYGDPSLTLRSVLSKSATQQERPTIHLESRPTKPVNGKRHEPPSSTPARSLAYPVRCVQCQRELKSHLLVAEVSEEAGQFQVICRGCSARFVESPTVEANIGLRTDARPLDERARPAAWFRLLQSLSRPRRVLDPATGLQGLASWQAIRSGGSHDTAATRETFRLVTATDKTAWSIRNDAAAFAPNWHLDLCWAATSPPPSDSHPAPPHPQPARMNKSELQAEVERVLARARPDPTQPPPVTSHASLFGVRFGTPHPSPGPAYRVVVFVSPEGWSEAAIAWATTARQQLAERHPFPVSVILIDLRQAKPLGDSADLHCQSVALFLDWEDETTRIHRVMEHVERLRPLPTSLSAVELAESLAVPIDSVLVAFRNLAAIKSLNLDNVAPFGWVLSESTDT